MSASHPPAKRPLRPPLITRKTLWAGAVWVAISFSLYTASQGQSAFINWGGLKQLGEFWFASLTPDLSLEFLGVMSRATLVTFAYAVCGTTLSVGLGFVGGIFVSETWWRTVLPPSAKGGWLGPWRLMRGLLAFPRAIHELIWGLVLLSILGLDPVVAVVAIAIPFSAIVAKVFSEILDETPLEPLNALLNGGTPPATAWLYGLLPQAFPNLLSYASYRFECSLRSAAVLGVIGAGGLGYEILLSLQSLRYSQLWTGFYALIILNGTVDLWSAWMRRRLGFTSRLDLHTRTGTKNKPNPSTLSNERSQDWGLRLSWSVMALTIPLCFWGLDIGWERLWSPRTRRLLIEMVTDAVPPWPNLASLQTLLHLSSLTLSMSILAIAFAGMGGILLSFPAAQTFVRPEGWLHPLGETKGSWGARSLFLSSRLILLVSRAIPAPIWALVFLFVLFPGVWPGALALAVHNFGILGRLMAEVNENLDDRPVRSLQTLGASPGQIILYGVLPQNLGRFLAYIFYRWEVCIRETVIVGLVGAGGLGRLITEQLSSFDYSGLTLTLGCFILLTFLVDLVSQQMRSVQKEL
jgi:phosphonate transport system permease protein